MRVYNWALEERRRVYLGHAPVSDVAYLDAATLLVAARERSGRRDDDGVAAFSALTGEPRHRFRMAHDRQPRSFRYDDLGFLDLRKNAAGVRWRSRSKLTMSGKTKACGEKTCCPKLATHGGQLAAVRVDGRHHLGVQQCRPRADVDAAVQQRRCGAICDFAVHSEENVFDAAAADHLTAKRLVFLPLHH
ncbi:hypothetical protein C2845_PM02G15050 [Panicum miliaceum]|uniref:At2g24240-like C-terminal beta-propeller domain-containing protein n=1 Tax=Panicum miliaceum TaxID=4540 RepID=A0A3L6SF60_PANMI|nr:hypothetical protein C2845_PM02G15050 [Panicum miliaceum]